MGCVHVVKTEDDEFGGLEAVLRITQLKYGLPPEAGLQGLLRHLENSYTFTLGIQRQQIESLSMKVMKLTEENNALKSPPKTPVYISVKPCCPQCKKHNCVTIGPRWCRGGDCICSHEDGKLDGQVSVK